MYCLCGTFFFVNLMPEVSIIKILCVASETQTKGTDSWTREGKGRRGRTGRVGLTYIH